MLNIPSSVAVVVVTYNRASLLMQTLQSLSLQTNVPHTIYVVDNASNDETNALLKDRTKIGSVSLKYIRLIENTGGAGGFSLGMTAAFDDGHEWIWVMDDDVIAVPDALDTLLSFRQISECIHGSRVGPEGARIPWGGKFNPKTCSTGKLVSDAFDDESTSLDYVSVSVACFEGMLIHRNVVAKIGFPDKRFFIAGDDSLYGYLASKVTTVLYVRKVVLKRLRGLNMQITMFGKKQIFSSLFNYYHPRNMFLTYSILKVSGDQVNLGAVFLQAFRYLVRVLLIDRDYGSAKRVVSGISDGMEFVVKKPSSDQR